MPKAEPSLAVSLSGSGEGTQGTHCNSNCPLTFDLVVGSIQGHNCGCGPLLGCLDCCQLVVADVEIHKLSRLAHNGRDSTAEHVAGEVSLHSTAQHRACVTNETILVANAEALSAHCASDHCPF